MRYLAILCLAGLMLSAGAFFTGCESGGDDSPNSHTLALGSVSHLEGHTNPLANCTECHGAALRGGSGPSCYSCHNDGDHNTVRERRRHRTGAQNSCPACHGPDNSGGIGPACSTCH